MDPAGCANRKPRQPEELQQQRTVHAVVADEHNRVVGMARQHEPQGVGRSGRKVLQRFAVREADHMRSSEPRGEECRMLSVSLRERYKLPGTVVEIVEIVTNLDRDAADLGYGICGLYAATHRACVDFARSPATRNALGNGSGLGAPLCGKLERLATAKPFRLDTFDVPMAD